MGCKPRRAAGVAAATLAALAAGVAAQPTGQDATGQDATGQDPAAQRAPRIAEGRDRVDAAVHAVELEAHVAYLASDELGGRDTGSPGEALAAAYLAERLAAAGWEPAGDPGADGAKTFLQRVPLTRVGALGDPRVVVGGDDAPLEWGTDYTVIGWAPVAGRFELTVAESLDDLPVTEGALFVPAGTRDRTAVLGALAARGDAAPAVVILPGPTRPGRAGGRLPRPRLETGAAPTMAVLRARGDLLARIEAGSVSALEVALDVAVEPLDAFNVVALLPGAGTVERPALADEVVVLSAHYDHLGTREARAGDEPGADLIYNGADDDASGVAAVIEVAEALALGERPARTFVALLATGEEKGLLGTREYLRRPVRPLAETVCNVNFEMLGRADDLAGGSGEVWLTGYELTSLGPAWASHGVELTPDPRPDQNFFQRSDNYAFVLEGIVAQTISSYDLHEDYHRVSDEWQTLDYEHMAAAVTLAARATGLLGSGAVTPAWTEGQQPAAR